MKKLIQNTGGYQLFAELKPIEALANREYVLKFSTVYDNAKDPDAEQIKFQIILDKSAVENLGSLFN